MPDSDERTAALPTNTQYQVMLGGYAWAISQIPDAGSKTLLDCACGTGYGTNRLADAALKVTGVDVSPEAIARCRAAYKRKNLSFELMDASALKFPDADFDGVVSQDTIEHVKDDRAFLAEIKRVLKPGGVLVIFTPHSSSHNDKPENIYHLREYSRESFDRLLGEYFSDRQYYGRRLSSGLAALEKELGSVRGWDKLGLRRLIPVRLRHAVAGALAKLKGLKSPAEITEADSEFFEGVGDSSTLIAVCKKEK